MYKCKYFKIHELVDQKTYENTPEWKLWLLFDDRLLKTIDFIREALGQPITINNWKWGGDRQWSGYRPPNTPYYSQFSQHSLGRAVDMVFSNISAQEVRDKLKDLINNGKLDHIALSFTFEESKSYRDTKRDALKWCHLDLRSNYKGYNEFYV